jgi:hypothetical protein
MFHCVLSPFTEEAGFPLATSVCNRYRLLGMPESSHSAIPSNDPPQLSMTLREPTLYSSQVISALGIPSEAQIGIARFSISVA